MVFRIFIAAASIAGFGFVCAAGELHPQDGPHADLRVAIEDRLVRLSVGVNLAFLDEAIDVPRESVGELSESEAERTLDGFGQLLLERAPCVINGEAIEPVVERLEIFTDPDPGMIAVFPKMGNRALIRATAVLRFDAPDFTETVDITWPTYPFDQLAEEIEAGGGVRPRMYFETVFTAVGKTSAARFTHAEPTIRWSRNEGSGADLLADLPTPAVISAPMNPAVWYAAFGAATLVVAGIGLTRRFGAARSGAFASVLILIAAGVMLRPRAVVVPVVSEPDAQQILRSIHESMYRAFDYTAESDIYDRLDLALEGALLGEMYEQIRLSLLQAEEDMKLGVVTGLEPIDTRIGAIDPAGPYPVGLGFGATHRWRVDGTVYHWGHSHTRAHIYEAEYRVEFTADGWRIVGHRLLSQQRIDPALGEPIDRSDEVQRILERLGQPDI